jgi:membrane protein YqaA with SNARE-associated domain
VAGFAGEAEEVLVAALGSVLGHNFTFWLGFKGGKGIATSAGAILATPSGRHRNLHLSVSRVARLPQETIKVLSQTLKYEWFHATNADSRPPATC